MRVDGWRWEGRECGAGFGVARTAGVGRGVAARWVPCPAPAQRGAVGCLVAGVTPWSEQGELRSAAACPLGVQQHLAGVSGRSSSGEEPRSASCGGRSSQLPTAQRSVVWCDSAWHAENIAGPPAWCSGGARHSSGSAPRPPGSSRGTWVHGGAAPASSSLLWRLVGWPHSKPHSQRLGGTAAKAEQRAEQRRRLKWSAQRSQHAQRRATRAARGAWPDPISDQQAHRGALILHTHVRGSPRPLLPPVLSKG